MLEIKDRKVIAETGISEREQVITFHTNGLGAFCGFIVVPADTAESIVSAINSGLGYMTSGAYGINAMLNTEKKTAPKGGERK